MRDILSPSISIQPAMPPLFLSKPFKASKCKTLLRLTVSRIKLLRSKTQVLTKQTRRDVAELLRTGQQAKASKRVELLYSQENSLAAYDLIEHYCDLVVSQLPSISTQKGCPPDLKEAVSSLIFAAPRCADLHELQKVRNVFETKYGKEFVVAAVELRPDCGVSKQIIEKLSSHSPAEKVKLKVMKEVAVENKIEWNSPALTDETVKLDEHRLNGPHFPNGNQASTANIGRDNFVLEPVKLLSSAQPGIPLGQTVTTFSSSSGSCKEDAQQVKGKFPLSVKHGQHLEVVPNFVERAGFEPQGTMNYSSFQDICKVDSHASAKLEGKMDYVNMYGPHSAPTKIMRAKSKEVFSDSEENVLKTFNQQFAFGASSTRGSNMECLEVVVAAQVAYESAAHAAAAARKVIDLTKHHISSSMNKMSYAGFDSEDHHGNANVFDKETGVHVAKNNIKCENLLDAEDIKVKISKKPMKKSSRSESEEEHDELKILTSESLVRNEVKSLPKIAHETTVGTNFENRKKLENSKAQNSKKDSEVSIFDSTNNDNLSRNEQEEKCVWPFMRDFRPQSSSITAKIAVGMSFDEDEIHRSSLLTFNPKEASNTYSLFGGKPKTALEFSGPKFDEDDDKRDDNKMISPMRSEGRDVDSSDYLGRRRVEEKASTWHVSLSEKDLEAHNRKPDEVLEKRPSLRSYNQPEISFIHGPETSKAEQTCYSDTNSKLNKPDDLVQRKLKWHSRDLEVHDSPLQSYRLLACEPSESFSSASGSDVIWHVQEGIGSHATHASASKMERGRDVSSPLRHNPYSAKNCRSVRSVRSKQSISHMKSRSEDDHTSYGMSYSISEETQESYVSEQADESNNRKINKANHSKQSPCNLDDDSPSVIDVSQTESRKDSVFPRFSSASFISDSSVDPSLNSYSSTLSSPNATFDPSYSKNLVSSQEKADMMPSDSSDSGLPDDDELIARLEALRKKR